MPTASRAKLQYEAGQSSSPMAALTDSGDHATFTSASAPWSRRDGYEPEVRPDGLITGGAVTPAASGTDDVVDVAAGTAYVGGLLVAFNAATDVAVGRGADPDTHRKSSITVDGSGTIAAVDGVDFSAHSDTRGADGGPPLIPTTSVEIGQVHTTSFTAAPIAAAEIKQVVGVHQERFDYPLWDVDYANGKVSFIDALPQIHTGSSTKKVAASYATPVFAEVGIAGDFVPPELSYSISSTQYYNKTVGQRSESLGAGSFTALLNDGVTDALVKLKGENLWFKFYPSRLKSPHVLCQGTLGIGRAFPAGDNISASCTIAAEEAGVDVAA